MGIGMLTRPCSHKFPGTNITSNADGTVQIFTCPLGCKATLCIFCQMFHFMEKHAFEQGYADLGQPVVQKDTGYHDRNPEFVAQILRGEFDGKMASLQRQMEQSLPPSEGGTAWTKINSRMDDLLATLNEHQKKLKDIETSSSVEAIRILIDSVASIQAKADVLSKTIEEVKASIPTKKDIIAMVRKPAYTPDEIPDAETVEPVTVTVNAVEALARTGRFTKLED